MHSLDSVPVNDVLATCCRFCNALHSVSYWNAVHSLPFFESVKPHSAELHIKM